MKYTISKGQLLICRFSSMALLTAMIVSMGIPARGADLATTSNINAATAVSNSTIGKQTLVFNAGYNPLDWSGYLVARELNMDGTLGAVVWDAGKELDASASDGRIIFSAKFNPDGSFGGGLEFREFSRLDEAAKLLLMRPPAASVTPDAYTGQARVDWLRGSRTDEANGTMRKRSTLLGAVVRSQPLYVSYPADGYRNMWPKTSGAQEAPESTAAEHPIVGTSYVSYEQFVRDQRTRKPAVYVGANDGMLHAFDASLNTDGSPSATAGEELWAYVPRSAYANLGELMRKSNNGFIPTVDATPVSRDVFFSRATSVPSVTTAGWHTIIVGALGGGGRGVYALDVTSPGPATSKSVVSVADATSKVLWEFEAGMPELGSSRDGGGTNPGGAPADLGYTYGQPNIGRLADGRWVVLIPSGVLPECEKVGTSKDCDSDEATHAVSALFVVDAQTGALIAELKTPTTISGVTSHALSSPVLGDYNDDQIDDVAFAGDGVGNLWRYDLSNSDPSRWTVKLLYKPQTPGAQPITVMPRLLPDPATNRFIVIFGTGGFTSDAGGISKTQAVYGIRDNGHLVEGTQNLIAQTLTEKTASGSGCNPVVRSLTNNPVPASNDGWYFNLVAPGERVLVSADALFDTNRVVITTSLDGNPSCSGGPQGAVMVVDAATGGAGDGISSPSSSYAPGGSPVVKVVGGRVNNPPGAGLLPVVGEIGGGKLIFPGMTLTGGGTITADDAVWRRRSWRELINGL